MKQFVKSANHAIRSRTLSHLATWVIEQGIRIQHIAAPTFGEENRAAYVAGQFRYLGLIDIGIDSEKNVYGLLKGLNRTVPALLVCAHTDTVFPVDTDLTTR